MWEAGGARTKEGSVTGMACTRIAPTPSGFLHVGNAANALVTAWWARELGAGIVLRIDDLDADRVRPEYLDDILELLHWLDIEWTVGPRSAQEAVELRSARIERARTRLQDALDGGLPAYACSCSRSMLSGIPTGGCPGGCRSRSLPLERDVTALRLAVDRGTTVTIGGEAIALDQEMGDVVIWRRDDLPAYQWSSTVEDLDLGVTHVVRGMDLVPSTAMQEHLRNLLEPSGPEPIEVRHHSLLLDDQGRKISKSQSGTSAGLPRDDVTRARIQHHARELASSVGIVLP